MNIGTRPTVDGSNRMIEVNLFDFDEEIYGRHLKVSLKHHLRSEVKFNGIEELKEQLHKDKEETIKQLADVLIRKCANKNKYNATNN